MLIIDLWKMNRIYFISMVLLLLYSCSKSVSVDIKQNECDKLFSLLLQENVDDSFGSVPGVSMTVISPLLHETWSGAAGYADDRQGEKLAQQQVFRIASVTKTFVATAILRLHEMDSLSIHLPISKYIDQSLIALLEKDGYNSDQILIKHCLNHTSGLADYAMAEEYIEELAKNPQKRWTRLEQIECAIKWGDKVGEPGERNHYSDTGYIILGAVLERFYKGNLAEALRTLLKFDSLGMSSTWLESLEEHPLANSAKVHRYHGRFETTEWNPSIDLYGGGGLVSNTADLATFYSALFDHKIYDQSTTLDLMLSVPEKHSRLETTNIDENKYYNYGFWTNYVFGHVVHMHTGFWGTTVVYIPEFRSTIAANTTRGSSDRMIKKVVMVLEQLNNMQ